LGVGYKRQYYEAAARTRLDFTPSDFISISVLVYVEYSVWSQRPQPAHLFALKWKCFDHEASATDVIETVYKGKIRPWGKTKKSLTVVHIPKELADDLQQWRE
jgi:hypothetical protein